MLVDEGYRQMFEDYRVCQITDRVYLFFKLDTIYKLPELKYGST